MYTTLTIDPTTLNIVVRSSYADKFYTNLAHDAILSWKDEKWGGTYHEYVCKIRVHSLIFFFLDHC